MFSFSEMPPLNKFALVLMIFAKLLGIVGVSMGFIPELHTIGGYILAASIVSIFGSVGCSLTQTSKDKKKFDAEDEKKKSIKRFNDIKKNLEQEIQALEERRDALKNLKIQRDIIL